MTCPQCKSENIIALEEQGEFTKIKYISKIFIILIFLLSIAISFAFVIFNDMYFSDTVIIIIVAIIICSICSLYNLIIFIKFKKSWIQKSRTKFVCMDCGTQWYKYSVKEEFFRH